MIDVAVKRDTRLLLTARFFMSAAQALSSVALPLALVHAGLGTSGIGAVLSVMVLVGLIEMILVGGYADRGYLRVFLVLFPLTSVLCAAPFVLRAGAVWLSVAAVIGGYGGGQGATSGGTGPYQPAEYAWIGRNYSNADRNRLVGIFSATSVAGVVLGSAFAIEARALAGLLHFGVGAADQARVLILFVGILAVVPTTIGFFVKEPVHLHPVTVGCRDVIWQIQRWRALLIPKESRSVLFRLSVVGGLNGVAVGCFGQFVTVWLILHFDASASTIGTINLLIAVAAVAGDLCCARFARWFGLIRSVIITRVVQSLLVIVVALSPNLHFAEVFLLIRQVAQRLNLPLRDSYSIARAPQHEMARVSALTSISNQSTMAASSEVSGVLISRIGYVVPFCVSGVIQLISAIVFYAYFARQPPPEEARTEIDVSGANFIPTPAATGGI